MRNARRRSTTVILLGVVLTVGGARFATLAAAQDWVGTISSASLRDLPSDGAFGVRIYDDTPENLAFRDRFLAALKAAGFATGEDPRLIFSFEPELTRSEPRTRRPGDRTIDASGAESRIGPVAPAVGFSEDEWLFGNQNKWVIRKSRTPQVVLPDRLHLNVTLRDDRTGTVIWYADLYCDVLEYDRERITRSVIGPIINRIGETRAAEHFAIR